MEQVKQQRFACFQQSFNLAQVKLKFVGVDAVKYPREARRKIGFLTGSTGLYARLSANEVIDYFASLYNVPNNVLKERKAYLYDLLNMNEFASKKIGKMSTGMKQKFQFVEP